MLKKKTINGGKKVTDKMKSSAESEKKIYNDQSISALKGPDRIRMRPAAILGSDGLEGCQHAFFEILSNAVDEAREGFGTEIKVTVTKDMVITVEDNGRGVPMNYNEKEGRYNWDLIFCELYAGGKYHNNDSDANYKFSLGLNGVGACATQCCSEFMTVRSYDGANVSEMNFKKGHPIGELSVRPIEKGEKKRGTVIKWKPDYSVFTSIDIPRSHFDEVLHRQAVVNSGVAFKLIYEEDSGKFSDTVYLYEQGISDYILEVVGENTLSPIEKWEIETSGKDRDDKAEYDLKAEIAFTFSNDTCMTEYYHNSSHLIHGGSTDKAVRNAFVFAIDKYIKAKGMAGKNDSKISQQDVIDCLVIVVNSFSTATSYENQTKKAITNPFIYDALYEFIKNKLEIYFTENEDVAKVICEQVLINKKSRENAETTRRNIKKKLMAAVDTSNRVEKFVNCRSKDPTLRELYIVEGDSALTSVKLARDAEFQAVIPVRGKTLNCLKVSYKKIFENEIIVDLLRVIGCGAEIEKTSGDDIPLFDLKRLPWSKIIICTDADEDGFQIRVLLLTMFYRLLPTLIKEGKVFIAESPLFEITCGKDTYFAYNEPEKAEILKKIGNKRCNIQRSKGLGENEPDMMSLTTMHPKTRRLIQISPTDEAETSRVFDILLGENIPARKEYIREFGHLYVNDLE
jgi:DNA gyrase subunit B